MTPLDESQLGQARELLQINKGPEDIARELTQLAQSGKIEKSQILGIANTLQETIKALQAILRPETGESSIATEWAKTIRERGVAMLHGKLHPFWFDDSPTPSQLTNEPGFQNHGFIGVSTPKQTAGEAPNGTVNTQIQKVSQVLGRTYEKEYLVVSPVINPQHSPNTEILNQISRITYQDGLNSQRITPAMKQESKFAEHARYCQTTLSSKFTTPIREVSYMFWASPNQLKDLDGNARLQWRGEQSDTSNDRPLQVALNIFLPKDIADKLVAEIKDDPAELPRLVAILYPKTQGEYPLSRLQGEKLAIIETSNVLDEDSANIQGAPTLALIKN